MEKSGEFLHNIAKVNILGAEVGVKTKTRRNIRNRYEGAKSETAKVLDIPGQLGKFVTKDHVTALLRVLGQAEGLKFAGFTNDSIQMQDLNETLRNFDERFEANRDKSAAFSPEDLKMFSWLNKLIEERVLDGSLVKLTESIPGSEDFLSEQSSAQEMRQETVEQLAVLINRVAKIKQQARGSVESFEVGRLTQLLDEVETFSERYIGALAFDNPELAENIHQEYLNSVRVVRAELKKYKENAGDLYLAKHLLVAAHYIDRSGVLTASYQTEAVRNFAQKPGIERLYSALVDLHAKADDKPMLYHFKQHTFDFERKVKYIGTYGSLMHIRPEVTLYAGCMAEYFKHREDEK